MTTLADEAFRGLLADEDTELLMKMYDAGGKQATTGTTDYGIPVVATVREGNVWGTQFHPEKSSKAGRQVLRNFLEVKPC